MVGEEVGAASASPPTEEDLQRAILRGDLTIERAVSSGQLTLKQIEDWQGRFLIKPGARPWESILVRVWSLATRGHLK